MLKIYHQTETSVGYLYLSWNEGEKTWLNFYEKFDDKFKLKSHLTQAKLDYLLYSLQAIVVCYASNNEETNHLEEKSLEIAHKILRWANEKEATIPQIKEKVFKYKPHFVTLVKSARAGKADQLMLHKCLFEFLDNE